MNSAFSPGDIVNVRGREWVCLPTADIANLCLRPLSGGESDIQVKRACSSLVFTFIERVRECIFPK